MKQAIIYARGRKRGRLQEQIAICKLFAKCNAYRAVRVVCQTGSFPAIRKIVCHSAEQTRSHRHKGGSQMRMIRNNSSINIEQLVADEVKRLSLQFGKSFLDCEDIISLTGLGRDNVRALMRSRRFPVVKVGKRQVVSILNFVTWQINETIGGHYAA